MTKVKLRLYVTGRTPESQRAVENLRAICESDPTSAYEVEVIDVLENPALAEKEKIFATPTLVRLLPEPVHKIIGDLGDREKVLHSLDLEPPENGEHS